RAKRILLAGAKAAMGQMGLLETPEPSVIVADIVNHDVEYKVRYWFTPWTDMAPGMAKDFVTASILEHLKKADIVPAYPRQDIFFCNPLNNITILPLSKQQNTL
ncbi:MAG: hypothetical protein MI892_23310, partial [Desulfobacterales bacterium]|nr:hypothetical protein [Desulfobacterales bacterium]